MDVEGDVDLEFAQEGRTVQFDLVGHVTHHLVETVVDAGQDTGLEVEGQAETGEEGRRGQE